jgi:hypothetical protein
MTKRRRGVFGCRRLMPQLARHQRAGDAERNRATVDEKARELISFSHLRLERAVSIAPRC